MRGLMEACLCASSEASLLHAAVHLRFIIVYWCSSSFTGVPRLFQMAASRAALGAAQCQQQLPHHGGYARMLATAAPAGHLTASSSGDGQLARWPTSISLRQPHPASTSTAPHPGTSMRTLAAAVPGFRRTRPSPASTTTPGWHFPAWR